MSLFKYNTLSADADFSKGSVTTPPTTVIGKDQMVYWKRCIIQVYKTGCEGGKPEGNIKNCDGEGIVPEGTSLFFFGINGLVKEV